MTTLSPSALLERPLQRRLPARTLSGHTLAGVLVAATVVGEVKFASNHRLVDDIAAFISLAGTFWFLTTRRTGLALAMLMFYLGALDGYLKLSTGSGYVTFVRDVLLYAIAIGVLLRSVVTRRPLSLPPLGLWVVAFIVIVLAEIANPENGTLYHSLAGVRQSLEFVPLFFLTFIYVRTTRALRVMAVLLLVLAVANGFADLIQFHESPQQLASWGPGYAERVLGTGDFSVAGRTFFSAGGQQLTRPFGLGSDSGDGGLVCAFSLGAALALASLPGRRRYLPLAILTAAIAIVGVITAQGRAVIGCALVVVLAYVLMSTTSRRAITTVLAMVVVGAAGYVVVNAAIGGSSTAVRASSLASTSLFNQISSNRGGSISNIPSYLVRYPFGAGLGVAGPASGTSGAPSEAGALDAENEILFAMLETGIPGLVVLLGFTLAVLWAGVRRCRQVKDPEARLLLAAIIAPVAGMFALYAVSALTPTTPGGPYLWAAGGIVAYWLVARPAELRREGSPASGVRAPSVTTATLAAG